MLGPCVVKRFRRFATCLAACACCIRIFSQDKVSGRTPGFVCWTPPSFLWKSVSTLGLFFLSKTSAFTQAVASVLVFGEKLQFSYGCVFNGGFLNCCYSVLVLCGRRDSQECEVAYRWSQCLQTEINIPPSPTKIIPAK